MDVSPHNDNTESGFVSRLRQNRALVFAMTWRLWRSRGKGGMFQLAWPIVTPLFLLAVYYYAFGVILQFRGMTGETPYALEMFSGMAIYNIFAECALSGATAILTQPGYVKNARFDLEVIPLSVTGCAILSGLIWLVIVSAAAGMSGLLSRQFLWLPVYLIPYFLFCAGITFFTSSISVFLRDFPQFLTLVIQSLFFLTPIIYPLTVIPESYRHLILLNPLTGFVNAIRDIILNRFVWDGAMLGTVYAVGLTAFAVGFGFFFKTKRGFADVM